MGLKSLEFFIFVLAAFLQWRLAPRWLGEHSDSRTRRILLLVSYAVLAIGFVLTIRPVSSLLPGWWVAWIRGSALAWACWSLVISTAWLISSRFAAFDPGRRRLLVNARAAVCAAPILATGIGFLVRKEFRLREVDIVIPGLPPDLAGLRIVQVSDIHLGPFLDERELARAVDIANETRAHLALVTGDLITTSQDPLDACIRQISRLRADAGVLGCLGNHERFAEAEHYTTQACRRVDVCMLRSQSQQLKFGSAVLNVAGVDYQSTREPYLVGTGRLVSRAQGHVNVLLSHNPDVFPVAARQGFDLTIAGHTHGGQVSVEILQKHLNIARFFTPFTYGLYHEGPSSIYVTRGIGTVGIPARIGAPPEIALLRLCAT